MRESNVPSVLPANVSGVVPAFAQIADLGPPRSECGVGCLMPWAGKLYVLNYVSHRRGTGTGTSLRVIDDQFRMTVVPETRGVDGTYANRMVHHPSNQIVIGPHVIDAEHRIRTVPELTEIRLAGVSPHLKDPQNLVYVLGMEGELFELNVHTLACTQIADLQKALDTENEGRVHFKDCFTHNGRLIVCNNDYMDEDFRRQRAQGRLAEWKGSGEWKIIDRNPYVGFGAILIFGGTTFALGWDQASALLNVHTKSNDTWTRYRLPKASHCFDHKWQTEWPRIRSVEHERLLMDAHGMFYEMSPHAYGDRVWGVRPISTHLWVIPDFCTWKGMLVLGSDNASADGGGNLTTAEPQSGIWMGKTDDLWSFGKPSGWGGPWWDEPVKAGVPSDAYLMTGFDKKCLHLSHRGESNVQVKVEIDFMGHGQWSTYDVFRLPPKGYVHHEFPSGFSAHWLRVTADSDTVASAQLHYT